MSKVIGYAYEAALHCCNCTKNRLGDDTIALHPKEDCKDMEGNSIHPVFNTDEPGDSGDYCDGCFINLRE